MDKIVLQVNSRTETGKRAQRLREAGQLPAVIYGRGAATQAIKVDAKLAERTYAEAGGNKIIAVKVDDSPVKNALFQDVQHDPMTGELIHADLYLVRMDEKITTEVPLHFTGESTAVYQQEGTLVKNLETLEIEALPADLPESVEVDISVLDDFEKEIRVSDLKIPAGVELLTDVEELVAKVEPPRSDEELAELDAEVVEELPEGVAEEPVEGEEAAAEGEDAGAAVSSDEAEKPPAE